MAGARLPPRAGRILPSACEKFGAFARLCSCRRWAPSLGAGAPGTRPLAHECAMPRPCRRRCSSAHGYAPGPWRRRTSLAHECAMPRPWHRRCPLAHVPWHANAPCPGPWRTATPPPLVAGAAPWARPLARECAMPGSKRMSTLPALGAGAVQCAPLRLLAHECDPSRYRHTALTLYAIFALNAVHV